MAENSQNSLSKVKLGVSVVVLMGALASVTFLASAWGESHFQGGPDDDRGKIEYVVGGTVEVEEGAEWEVLSGQTLADGMALRTGSDSQLGIMIEEADLFTLFENTEVVFEEVDLESEPAQIKASLISGEVWMSDLQGTVDWVLDSEVLRVEPEDGSTYVTADDEEIYVLAAHHPTKVSFLENGEVLNSYHLTESHELMVTKARVTSVIGQLRYMKLTKEFAFIYLDEDDWPGFVESAVKEDKKRLSKVYSDFLGSLKRGGTSGYEEDSFMADAVEWYRTVRSYLTFSDQHLLEVEEDEDVDLLIQSLYSAQQGEAELAEDRLNDFKKEAADFETLEKLEDFDRIFRSVYYGDIFYEAKVVVRDIQYDRTSSDKRLDLSMQFLRESLNGVYDLLDKGDRTEAKQALLVYSEDWQDLLDDMGSELSEMVEVLTAERQIVQNLLYREDTFYEVASYEVLSVLEDEILTLTAKEGDLNEERQAFARDKLSSLDRLIDLVDDELVGVDESLDLAYMLTSEARDLLNDVTTETAVKSYFMDRLRDFSLMFEFVASSDFKLTEGDFDEKFEAYLEKEGEMEALADYIRGLTDDEEDTTITLDEAEAEVEKALDAARVDYSTIISLGDLNYRLFQIKGAEMNGVSFDANYDRVSENVYDLEVEGEVFPAGVSLDGLEAAIISATTEEVEEEDDDIEREEGLTSLELIIIDYAVSVLLGEGVEVTDEQVSIVDLEKDLFEVEHEMEYEHLPVQVKFLFDSEKIEVSEIQVIYNGESFAAPDTMMASELETFVETNLAPQEIETEEE
jgi:hypothetical protein